MAVESWCKSDKGLRRETNQDSFLINQDLGLYVVADGMGGHSGGEVASSLAVSTAELTIVNYSTSSLSPRDMISFIYAEASKRIYDKAANERPELLGMGTTMVMLMQKDSKFYIGNVGDSRCYLFRKPYLWQITEDHSLINEQLKAGLITEDQLRSQVNRNVITRSVGYEREVVADVVERTLNKGDMYLLCSDGLSSLVVDQKITEIMNNYPPEQIVDRCIQEALNNGGDDNVTVMLVCVK